MKKLFLSTLFIVLGFTSIWAQIPACPSGCTGANTFLGIGAGLNTAVNIGVGNTFLGARAGQTNTSGRSNTFVGADAGFSNTSGNFNAFFGLDAGRSNSTGENNAFFGINSGRNNLTGSGNAFFGKESGRSNNSANFNAFFGTNAGALNFNGNRNTFVGTESGNSNVGGSQNTILGFQAGFNNSSGSFNTFVGVNAGRSNNIGGNNTFVGISAGFGNTNGQNNTFVGRNAGFGNTTGRLNTFLGTDAGASNITGNNNTYVGREAGAANTQGSGNVFIGHQAGLNETGSNKLYIANDDTEAPLIYGDFTRNLLGINGPVGIGTQTPQRPLHLRSSNAVLRIDRNQDAPGIALVRFSSDFNRVLQSHYIYTRATNGTNGLFVIADWGKRVSGPSIPRLVIDGQGRVGLGVGFVPTAQLHNKGSVRFEELPQGDGEALVIDSLGNITRSGVILGAESIQGLQEENESLRLELEEMKERLAQLEANFSKLSDGPSQELPASQLYQNTPNPFNKSTAISFYLGQKAKQATLFIYDMQGTQIKRFEIDQRGEGKIALQAGTLKAGMYLYSLIVDGKEIDMKRMQITD